LKQFILIVLIMIALNANAKVIMTAPPVFESCPMMLMIEDNLFEHNGIDATFIPWSSPDQYRSMLFSDNEVFAVVSSLEYKRFKNNNKFQLIYNLGGSPLWLLGSREIKGFKELENSKIALPFRGDMPEILLNMLFSIAGVDKDRVEIVSAGGGITSAQLVMTGRADYVIMPEPIAYFLEKFSSSKKGLRPIKRLLSVGDEWNKFESVPPLLISGVAGVNVKPESLKVLKSAYERYYERCRADFTHSAKIFKEYFPAMKGEDISIMFKEHKGSIYKSKDIKEDFERFIKLMEREIDSGF